MSMNRSLIWPNKPFELEDVRHCLALPGVAAPGEHLHLVGHARLELADGGTAPRPENAR